MTRLFAASGVGCSDGFGFSRVGCCWIRFKRASRAARALSSFGSSMIDVQTWIAFPIPHGCRESEFAPSEILQEQTEATEFRYWRSARRASVNLVRLRRQLRFLCPLATAVGVASCWISSPAPLQQPSSRLGLGDQPLQSFLFGLLSFRADHPPGHELAITRGLALKEIPGLRPSPELLLLGLSQHR